jgi:hypothetical protein
LEKIQKQLKDQINIIRRVMKNYYFILAVVLLIAGIFFAGCENNRDDARDDVNKANQDMIDDQYKFDTEWQEYRK